MDLIIFESQHSSRSGVENSNSGASAIQCNTVKYCTVQYSAQRGLSTYPPYSVGELGEGGGHTREFTRSWSLWAGVGWYVWWRYHQKLDTLWEGDADPECRW